MNRDKDHNEDTNTLPYLYNMAGWSRQQIEEGTEFSWQAQRWLTKDFPLDCAYLCMEAEALEDNLKRSALKIMISKLRGKDLADEDELFRYRLRRYEYITGWNSRTEDFPFGRFESKSVPPKAEDDDLPL